MRLERIFNELQSIRRRLDDLERLFLNRQCAPVQIAASKLLELPDNLRKTYIALASRDGDATATDVSAATGRVCAIESHYLNELTLMGWTTKRRVSKTQTFRVNGHARN